MEEIIAELNAQRDAYLRTFARAHEAVVDSITKSSDIAGSSGINRSLKVSSDVLAPPLLPSPSSPTLQAPPTSLLVAGGGPTVSRRPSHSGGHRPKFDHSDAHNDLHNDALSSNVPAHFDASTLTSDSETDDDDSFYVTERLPTQSFDHEHLRNHLKTHDFNSQGREILANIINERGRLKNPSLFPEHGESAEDKKNYSHYQVFDVGDDGYPRPVAKSDEFDQTTSRSRQIWHAIKDINAGGGEKKAVGRITVAREPSPILFGALHLTFNNILDMDEIFNYLVESESTTVDLYSSFGVDERRRRSFFFNFEYYTIIGEERQPMVWQLSDDNPTASESHLPLSRCSSVIALSLFGKPIKRIRNSARRARKREGEIYDPWQAWQILHIQCYPDWKAKTDVHDSNKRYVNGPEAFLHTILFEYQDAQKRFEEIYRQISKLITPPFDFIFNEEMRNRRLFEDKEFTYTRRYFWAHQTLGTMNDSIQAMIDAYEDNFPAELWEGRHKTLWPLSEHDATGRNAYWRKRLRNLKMEFTKEINALRTLIKENNDRRAEIRFLRDQLFSGTSVMESRKSVELSEITIQQGHNIKLLTLVNIFFLPLTFISSIFGMTNMPTQHSYWPFAVTTVSICVPFFLLIGSLNSTRGVHFWRRSVNAAWNWAVRCVEARKKKKLEAQQTSTVRPGDILRSMSAENGIDFREGRAGKVYTIDVEKEPASKPDVTITKPTLAALVARQPSFAFPFGNGASRVSTTNAESPDNGPEPPKGGKDKEKQKGEI